MAEQENGGKMLRGFVRPRPVETPGAGERLDVPNEHAEKMPSAPRTRPRWSVGGTGRPADRTPGWGGECIQGGQPLRVSR
jgi:hypothetical protein